MCIQKTLSCIAYGQNNHKWKTGLAKWLAAMCRWPNTPDELIISGCDWAWVLADYGFRSLRCCDATAKRKKTSRITFHQSGRWYEVMRLLPISGNPSNGHVGEKWKKIRHLPIFQEMGMSKKMFKNVVEAKHRLIAITSSHLWLPRLKFS